MGRQMMEHSAVIDKIHLRERRELQRVSTEKGEL